MRPMPTTDEVDAYGALLMEEGEHGINAPGDGEWSIAMFVYQWDTWVFEIESGGLWFEVEWEAACACREDLDASMEAFGASDDFMKLVLFVDRIDQRFERSTVASGSTVGYPREAWWWHRVPRRTDQRLFLVDRWRPRT